MEREVKRGGKPVLKIIKIALCAILGLVLSLPGYALELYRLHFNYLPPVINRLKYDFYFTTEMAGGRTMFVGDDMYIESTEEVYSLERDAVEKAEYGEICGMTRYGFDCICYYAKGDKGRRFILAQPQDYDVFQGWMPDRIFIRSDCTEEDFIEFVEENAAVAP